MNKNFNYIGIAGSFYSKSAFSTYKIVYDLLKLKGYNIIIEQHIAYKLSIKEVKIGDLQYIGKNADLAIIIGGDGSILNAARILSFYDIKIIGINHGNLGFLTDISPDNVKKELSNIVKGNYFFENRFLLEAKKINKNFFSSKIEIAINEIVLHSSKIAKMIEFEVYIDKKFAFSQKSNGLIISTPTGSTAYSLSVGGPILSPLLKGVLLIPIFPHTLSSRPLVISNTSIIQISFNNKQKEIEMSCDSKVTIPIKENETILIKKSKHCLSLIHPLNFNYYNSLISKLGWLKKLF